MSPSFEDGLRRFNFSLGLFAGGSWSALELDLLVVIDGMSDDVALGVGPGVHALLAGTLGFLANGAGEVK